MKKTIIQAIILSAFTLGVFLLAAAIASGDHSASVTKISEQVVPGYETQSAYYFVEASPAKIWSDTGGFLRTLGFILAALTGLVVLWVGEDTDKTKQARWLVIGIWGLSASFIFTSHSSKFGSADYTMKICPIKYEQVKDRLDSLFPNSIHPEEPLNNCK